MSDIQLSTANPLEIAARVLLDIHAGSDYPMEHWDSPVCPDSVALMRQARDTVRGRSLVYVPGLGWWKYSRPQGRWVEVQEQELRLHIYLYDGAKYGRPKEDKNHNLSWTLTQITAGREADILTKMKTIVTEPDFFKGAPASYGIGDSLTAVVENGVFMWEHPSPELRCRFGMDYQGQKLPPPDEIQEAIHRVLDKPKAVQPELDAHRAQFFEWLGLSMLGLATKYARGLVIIGDFGGGNGKGWLMDTVAALFPPEARKQTTGELDLKMDYQRGALRGKRLFICREMDQIRSIKSLNGLVAGDTLDGRRLSGDRNNFDFQAQMGVAMDVNLNLPPLNKDGLGGVMRRWCPLWAVNKLNGTVSRQDLEDMVSRQLPALAFLGLDAARKVLERKALTKLTETQTATLRGWLKEADPVAIWVDEAIQANPAGSALTQLMFRDYCRWADHHRFKEMTYVGFSRSLRRWLTPLGGRHSTHLDGGRGWKGVTLKAVKGRIGDGYRTDRDSVS